MTTIAAATSADLPALLELLGQSALPTAGLADHLDTTLVAHEAGHVVGSAALELYGTTALLRSVAVAPGLRGRGLGQELTRHALALARRRKIRTVYLLTETAGGFFPRFGFRAISRDAVDPAVQRSVEFTSACPTSALAMAAELERRAST
ncbi:MAG: GNAT family N-acetyltransferase [Gemmatimonadetes bacterium]|nr:MAG: GNAT family N-acetyltransferase [Gemmatimonadota bacterium]